MVRYVTSRVPTDGTNDVPVDLSGTGPMVSLTVYALTTATCSVKPGSSGDFLDLQNGDILVLGEAGRLIDPMKVTLRNTTAVAITFIVVVCYP